MEFGGWEMPLAYPQGTLAEHRACREDSVAFDVSHLGTVRVEGPDAFDRLQAALSNDLRRVAPGRAQYTHLLDEDGSVVDDIIVWWLSENAFDVMPNASNTDRVVGAIGGRGHHGRTRRHRRAGPARPDPPGRRWPPRPPAVPRFAGRPASCGTAWPAWPPGTGYTGEDGVELAVPADAADALWSALLAAGIQPAGLGARDTLRLEAALPLHGHELGPGITPLQAGLGWVVGWDKAEFRGREALEAERHDGVRRRLVGLATEGRQPPREGGYGRRRRSAGGHGDQWELLAHAGARDRPGPAGQHRRCRDGRRRHRRPGPGHRATGTGSCRPGWWRPPSSGPGSGHPADDRLPAPHWASARPVR